MKGSVIHEPLDQRNVVELVHRRLEGEPLLGRSALDGTAGNGHDTRKLAERVGPSGQVVAVDIAQAAIRATRTRLEEAGLLGRVRLIQGDHGDLAALLRGTTEPFSAAVFNLGYLPGHLPGGVRQQLTAPDSTVRALDAALTRLAPGALLIAACYTGHPEGVLEAKAVRDWSQALAPECDSVHLIRDRGPAAIGRPEVVILRRRT